MLHKQLTRLRKLAQHMLVWQTLRNARCTIWQGKSQETTRVPHSIKDSTSAKTNSSRELTLRKSSTCSLAVMSLEIKGAICVNSSSTISVNVLKINKKKLLSQSCLDNSHLFCLSSLFLSWLVLQTPLVQLIAQITCATTSFHSLKVTLIPTN